MIRQTPIAAAVALVLGGVAFSAAAQQAPSQPTSTQKVERVEVTGSNIKRTDSETVSPIQVIKAEEIRRSGATTVAELLKLVPAATSGGLDDISGGTGFARGASTTSLRGLGSSATLILLNGRRLAPAAYADPNTGQSNVFNLNNIPVSALERIDIFKDGASAVYGSDAIAGVINFVLKNDYRGAEASLSYITPEEGNGGATTRLSGVFGFGNLARDRFNVLITGEHNERTALSLNDAKGLQVEQYRRINLRLDPTASTFSYPGNFYREAVRGSGTYGTLVGPAAGNGCTAIINNTCRWDLFAPLDAVAPSKSDSILARGNFQFSENMLGYAEAGYARSEVEFRSNPFAADNNGTVWFTAAGNRNFFRFVLPANHPDNPLFRANPANLNTVAMRYRFADIPRLDTTTNESMRFLAGLKGTHFDWDWEAGFLYHKTKRENDGRGYILADELQRSINSLEYRPGAQNSAAVIARISPPNVETGSATTSILDFKGSRELFAMAGGQAAIALGAEYREEKLNVTPDPNNLAGRFFGLGTSSANGKRDVTSLYGEIRLPVLKTLEAEAAIRYDKYSDYGSSTTPKVGMKWRPTERVALRGTYSEGFRAPGLTQISQSSVASFNTIIDPVRCAANVNPATLEPGTNECTAGRGIASSIRANPNLKPEESKSFTLGVILQPTDNISATIDFYQIKRQNELDRLSSVYVIGQAAIGNPDFVNVVARDQDQATWVRDRAGNLIPNSGRVISTIRQFRNLGETVVKGVDVELTHRANLGVGKLETRANAAYVSSYKWKRFATDATLTEYAGAYGPSGPIPRIRAGISTAFTRGDWTVTGAANMTGAWFYGDSSRCDMTAAAQAELPSCKVSAYATYDLGLRYAGIKNLTISGLVRNLTDKPAPYDPDFGTLGYNPSLHNPYGRMYSLSLSYKFF